MKFEIGTYRRIVRERENVIMILVLQNSKVGTFFNALDIISAPISDTSCGMFQIERQTKLCPKFGDIPKHVPDEIFC